MKVIVFKIKLKAPAIFTRLSGDPDTIATWNHIPGSTRMSPK